MFVKITPPVPNEISNLHVLLRKNFNQLTLPTCFGTSSQHGVLIAPAMDRPNFLVEEVCDQLSRKEISSNEFIFKEKQVLDCICSLQLLNQSDEVVYP